jgi:hypothetical protein
MNASDNCTCTNCPGAGCNCGCRDNAALVALPAACHCGTACGCESAASGCLCR